MCRGDCRWAVNLIGEQPLFGLGPLIPVIKGMLGLAIEHAVYSALLALCYMIICCKGLNTSACIPCATCLFYMYMSIDPS